MVSNNFENCSPFFLGGSAEVREQRDEHQAIQLFTSSLLAAQLHGRIHVVPAVCR